MPHTDALYRWIERVQTTFPDLRPHHARALAEYSFGLVLARCCGLTQVVTYLAGFLTVSAHTLRQRLRELYQPAAVQRGTARSTFDPSVCFGPLIRWAAAGQSDRRLLLALDPTCLTDRFRVLCISVLYQGCGLPVAWAVQTVEQKGSWNAIWIDLLGRLHAALGDGWTVLVLTDRGLESPTLFRAITALGWHPLMRVKAAGQFRPTGWHGRWPLSRFAASVGRRWVGSGQAYPSGARLDCTLLACWDAGHAEPWLVLTDLPAVAANPAWYAWRMWIEQGFKVIKSGQWQWQYTRMTEAARAERLWAVLALATLWMMEVGGEGEALTLPALPRSVRLVRAGLLRLALALLRQEALPPGRLHPHDWPQREWQPDVIIEATMNQC